MKFLNWKSKAKVIEPSSEVIQARAEADKTADQALALATEAQRLADRLFRSRQENHYAERIRIAYELEKR